MRGLAGLRGERAIRPSSGGKTPPGHWNGLQTDTGAKGPHQQTGRIARKLYSQARPATLTAAAIETGASTGIIQPDYLAWTAIGNDCSVSQRTFPKPIGRLRTGPAAHPDGVPADTLETLSEEEAAEGRDILAERRETLDDAEAIAAYAREVREFLVESELTERRAFIKSFVKEIDVTPDDALPRYAVPTPENAEYPEGPENVTLDGPVLPTTKMVGLDGLEPSTSVLSGPRSNRLSYRPGRGKCALLRNHRAKAAGDTVLQLYPFTTGRTSGRFPVFPTCWRQGGHFTMALLYHRPCTPQQATKPLVLPPPV